MGGIRDLSSNTDICLRAVHVHSMCIQRSQCIADRCHCAVDVWQAIVEMQQGTIDLRQREADM